jgi:2-dehydro-3-deoxygluconokinase
MKNIVTFGEIMIRFDALNNNRFCQAIPGILQTTFAGAEANVAVSISRLGGKSRFVSAIPKNPISNCCVSVLQSFGVDVNHIVFTNEGRFGAYYVETGANQRPSNVLYDREGSAIARANPILYDWDSAFTNSQWFHVTGIMPALSESATESTLQAVKHAKKLGLTVSCDLNFRKKLWRWEPGTPPEELAGRTMRKILPFVDLLIANEEDAETVLGLKVEGTNVEQGIIDPNGYLKVARLIGEQFENIKLVATTLRESISATHNNWGATICNLVTGESYLAPLKGGVYHPYKIHSIVDRVGGGDSFAAALIYALSQKDLCELQTAITFATAASCLAHSIRGDFNLTTREEVEALAAGSTSGRVIR